MKTFLLWLKRLFGIAEATTLQAMKNSDKKVDIVAHANLLIQKQKDQSKIITESRNGVIAQQKALELDLKKKETRLDNITKVIIADSKLDEKEKDATYRQRVRTAAHEGPLLVQSIELIKENLIVTEKTLENFITNSGIIDRNIMSITHQLELLKSRAALASAKNQAYTQVEADSYFNLAKLEEIVESKEIEADTNEAIHNLDNLTVQEDSISADSFVQSILSAERTKDAPTT